MTLPAGTRLQCGSVFQAGRFRTHEHSRWSDRHIHFQLEWNVDGITAGNSRKGAAENRCDLVYKLYSPLRPNTFGVTESESAADILYNGTSNPIMVTSVAVSGANPLDWTAALGSGPTGNDCSADNIVPANSYCYISGSVYSAFGGKEFGRLL